MKSKFFIGAMIALMAIAACTKEQQPMQNEQSTEGPVSALVVSASTEQPGGTKTSLEGLNVKWTVGDKIYLTDGTNYAIYQATTNATTTSFSYVSGSGTFAESTDVYAYYPADKLVGDTPFNSTTKAFTASIPATQPYTAGGFADGINPMTAKATVSSGALVLSFKNVMAFVKLQIADSAADGKVLTGLSLTSPSANLSGTATVTVGTSGVASTVISTGSNTVELSGVNASLSAIAASAYIAVPSYALGALTITANTSESTGAYTQTKTASGSLTPERSSINTYNPMQISSFTGKTGGAEAAANCYMIDASTRSSIIIPLSQASAGWDAIKALEPSDTFDKIKITSGERTIAVRWLDGASGTITLSAISANYMTLSLACANGTNAVVDLKNGSEIVWSWHLWFTDYKPASDQDHTVNGQVHTYSGAAFQEGGLYYGKVMMDRNLGATVTGVSGAISQPSTEAQAKTYFGLCYQFGRKDPFELTGTVTTKSSSGNTYAIAAQNPATFYKTSHPASPWNMTDSGASTAIDSWNSNVTMSKSAFDPCPTGWRVPNNGKTAKNNVWTSITTSAWQSGSDLTSGYLWDCTCGSENSSAWIPACGNRSPLHGLNENTGNDVKYWAACPFTSGQGFYAIFSSTMVNTVCNDGAGRAYGYCIRCVKE